MVLPRGLLSILGTVLHHCCFRHFRHLHRLRLPCFDPPSPIPDTLVPVYINITNQPVDCLVRYFLCSLPMVGCFFLLLVP
jgi:hypothetical protein